MGVISKIRGLFRSDDKPSCPGCGRPVGDAGDVCATCSGDQPRESGG